MNIKSEMHSNEYIRDEDNGPGESTMGVNIYLEFQGIMPSEKDKIRTIVDRFYKEIKSELKNIG